MKTNFNEFLNEEIADYQKERFKPKNLEEFYNTYIDAKYRYLPNLLRDQLDRNLKAFGKSYSKILKEVVNPNSTEAKYYEELVSKLPTNKLAFKIFKEYILYALENTKYRPNQEEYYNKIKEDVINTLEEIRIKDVKSVSNWNFNRFLYLYRFFIFSFDSYERVFTMLYDVSNRSKKSEKELSNFLEKRGDTIIPITLEDDINHIDLKVIGNYPSKFKNENGETTFQVKQANHYRFPDERGMFINDTNLELGTILDKKKTFDYLVFVTKKEFIFIPRLSIKSVKGFESRGKSNYNITFTTESIENKSTHKIVEK